ncbi:MAG: peptide ABC transporter substrate-binding protein [Candidatus Eremiobacteraeota bacterium]|nr:peptide ABC transporter substrate-binding protein [Candidatus Eremiobacteraeota bacterium]
MNQRFLVAGALLALALSACTKVGQTTGVGAEGSSGGTAPRSDRLVISTAADPKNLNPGFASASPVLELSAFLYSYTVIYDDHAQPVPDAITELPTVENGDVSKDGLTLTYKLRHDIKWTDGPSLTCADMRFTWQVMMNPANNVITTEGWREIKDVDCSDPYVAVVHLKHVYAPYLQQLWSLNGNGPILPEHLLAKLNDKQGSLNKAPYNSAPVGSGPYKFVSWDRGSQIRLEVNPDFYGGKPKIAEVVYKIIPDQNTMATQLQTHELDLAWNLAPSTYDRVKAISGDTVVTPVIYTYDHIDFNLRRPIFQDVRVRRALTYAVDRKALLDKVRHGLGELSDSFLDPTLHSEAQVSDLMRYPYDPAKAKELLDEAGWKVGPDGIRVKNGQKLQFQISTQTESIAGQANEQQVQEFWHAVGADAIVKNYPTPLFFDNTANGTLQGGKYDVAFFAWVGAADLDQAAIYSGTNFAPHGQNALFWNNPVATKAMDDANQTVDMPRRIADYKTVQREFAKDDPSIILWFRKDLEVYTSQLKGFTPTPVITTPFWHPEGFHY